MTHDVNFQKEIIAKIKPIISSWTEDDIYAISFFVDDEADNPCEPTFTLGYNTEREYNSALNSAYDELEARWNYAFWQQNEELVFGVGNTSEIVKQWILDKGLPYLTYDEMFQGDPIKNYSNIFDKRFEKITIEFVNVLINVVKELHETEFIKNKFGKEIPIIIHELEYYPQIAIQNIEANTLPLVQGLSEFCGYCPE